jgi:hypothetical protein
MSEKPNKGGRTKLEIDGDLVEKLAMQLRPMRSNLNTHE